MDSHWFWLDGWIRIRSGNANPDPGGKKVSHKKGKKLRNVLLEVLEASPVALLKKQIIFFVQLSKFCNFLTLLLSWSHFPSHTRTVPTFIM
jgi:hypothetical protein